MSKNAALFGVGRMGLAITYGLSKLGHRVKFSFVTTHLIQDPDNPYDILSSGFDIVISSLPYHQTKGLASYCIEKNIPYCDLGGSVPVSLEINSLAEEKNKGNVFTDLGLAPGLVNILAEWGYHELGGADSISMMVGGLPASPPNMLANPLNYTVTWSVDGLINEYKDSCEILIDGKIKEVEGMSGLQLVHSKKLDELEAFYTSGGAAHTIKTMKERGVANCSYKTLRYKGHREIVNFLMRDCELPNECLKHIFEKGCSSVHSSDLVIVIVEIKKGNMTWKKEIVVFSDERYSAMQKATAFSIASVADLICEGKMPPKSLSMKYADVPFGSFIHNLETLGLKI